MNARRELHYDGIYKINLFGKEKLICPWNEITGFRIQVGNKDIRGCMACGACGNLGKCVFDELNKYFTISNMPGHTLLINKNNFQESI